MEIDQQQIITSVIAGVITAIIVLIIIDNKALNPLTGKK